MRTGLACGYRPGRVGWSRLSPPPNRTPKAGTWHDLVGTHTASRQAGAALVMGMVLLTLLSLLGLTALGTGVMEQRMAANARDRIRAFEAAEAGLRACEARVPLYRHATEIPEQAPADLGVAIPLVAEGPRCTIMRVQTVTGGSQSMETAVHEVDSYQVFRLTVRSSGINANTVVRLEAHVRQRV